MSEYRPFCWKIRDLATETQVSKTHLFPRETRFALCGRAVPRDRSAWQDTSDNESQYCKRCLVSAERIAREGKR